MTTPPLAVSRPAPALVIVDVQKGFAVEAVWGRPNNPAFPRNIATLIAAWQSAGAPIVVVRHDSVEPASTLRPGQDGNDLTDDVAGVTPDVLVVKDVNSAFLGTPDLAEWLRARSIAQIVLCGISTNTCVETTARMGQNLGFDVVFVVDATRAFPLTGPDGTTLSAEDLTRATVVNLSASGFARIATTADAASAIAGVHAS